MEVVLLEHVEKLGAIGDVVSVKPGFARNFLIPQGKALRANKMNIERFEREREAIEKRNAEKRAAAQDLAKGLEGETFLLIRQAGETGHLYGSVSARDIAIEIGERVNRSQIAMQHPIKEVGLHEVAINLHPEVSITINANVARTLEEGERQARGENVIESAAEEDRTAAAEVADEQAAAMFDPEADVELEATSDEEPVEADAAAAEADAEEEA